MLASFFNINLHGSDLSALSPALRDLADRSIEQLRSAVATYGSVCYANSLGSESMVLTDLIWGFVPEIEIFTVDTGRLFPESYDLIDEIQQRYGRAMRVYYPEAETLEEWVAAHGINGFRDGLEERRTCCGIRKLEPFRRAIDGRRAWVTGIRRTQSASRALAAPVEWDGIYGLYKISPLLDWSEQDIWDYIRAQSLPYNRLHDAGFPSIGCAPCTRAVQAGDDERSGRWWWERADSRECGLHPRRKITPAVLASAAPQAATPGGGEAPPKHAELRDTP
jgi:phosphoadenosine phosphosulfate reductase